VASTTGFTKVLAHEKWADRLAKLANSEIGTVEIVEQRLLEKPLGATMRWVGNPPNLRDSEVLSSPDVAIFTGPVTESGRRELLPFFKEQAVSITAHRFGNPLPLIDEAVDRVMQRLQ